MKHDLCKFLHWLTSSTFRNGILENQVKKQIISILSWFLYPDFRKQYSLWSIVTKNKIIISTLTLFLVWSVSFFTFGRLTTDEKYFEKVKIEYDTAYVKVIFDKNIRRFIEYNCKEKYKIKNYQNLQKLPDEVLFTIVSEITDKKIPPSLFFRLIDQESSFLDIINKSSGASGLTQILPSTKRVLLKKIGSTNHYLIDNVRMGAYHLKIQHDKYREMGFSEKESWFKSLVDYNGGSETLANHNLEFYHQELEFIKKGD